ncbi:MAG: tyrosine-type recombinase/integrase [Armatimonadota bacterium]
MAQGTSIRISEVIRPADSLPSAIDAFMVFCRAKNLSENTLLYYRYRLDSFQRFLAKHTGISAPRDVTRQTIREFLNVEMNEHSPTTANHSVITLKAFFGFLLEEGFLDNNPSAGISKIRCKKRLIETFSAEQVEAMLATCNKSFQGIRDKAMILILYDCGLRASELCDIRLESIDWYAQTISVIGKGDKERLVSFGKATRLALAQYIARRPEVEASQLFITCYGDPLERHRLGAVIKKRCKQAGITGVRCSPHTLRHTFAVNYLRAGGDVFSLQKILGHSDLTMTRRYCELSQTDALERHRMYSPADRLQSPKPTGRRKRIA